MTADPKSVVTGRAVGPAPSFAFAFMEPGCGYPTYVYISWR